MDSEPPPAWPVPCPAGPFPGLGRTGPPRVEASCTGRSSLGLVRPWVQAWPGSTFANSLLSLSVSFSQLKAFKDEEKARNALRQQKRKAKVRRLEGGSRTGRVSASSGSCSLMGEALFAPVSC